MRRFVIPVFALLLVLAVSTSICAQQEAAVRKTILDYRSELNLTDSQIGKIKGHLEAFGARAKDLGRKINEVNKDVLSYLEKDKGLSEANKKKIKTAFELRADLAIADIETGIKINKTLTPEQFKKWKEIRKSEFEKRTLSK